VQKPTAEELEERNTFLADMQKEFARTYQQVRGRALPKAGGGSEFAAMTADEVISGAARNVRREKVTAAQQQVLLEINEEQKVQDELLDMMSGTLENLKQLAHTIHDEVEMQNKVLDDTIEKVDKTSQQLDRVNDRMKDTLEKVRRDVTRRDVTPRIVRACRSVTVYRWCAPLCDAGEREEHEDLCVPHLHHHPAGAAPSHLQHVAEVKAELSCPNAPVT
jgi:hypothetical protein